MIKNVIFDFIASTVSSKETTFNSFDIPFIRHNTINIITEIIITSIFISITKNIIL